MAELLGKTRLTPEITGAYRMGDVRHCFADIALAKKLLGYEPVVEFDEGLAELAAWLETTPGIVVKDRAAAAKAELDARGLTL
jgi:dTDP-L-rhamnose 4-epimerase